MKRQKRSNANLTLRLGTSNPQGSMETSARDTGASAPYVHDYLVVTPRTKVQKKILRSNHSQQHQAYDQLNSTENILSDGGATLLTETLSSNGDAGSSQSQTTRKANNHRDGRRQWSIEEIKELMYCFYAAKAQGPGYLSRLEAFFIARNPTNDKIHRFNGNTLAAQARHVLSKSIISKQLLSEIEKIATNCPSNEKVNVLLSRETGSDHVDTDMMAPNEIDIPSALSLEVHQSTEVNGNREIENKAKELFLQNLSEVREIGVANRPFLPRAKVTREFMANIKFLNEFISTILEAESSLLDINNIVYAIAKTVIELNGQKPIQSLSMKNKQRMPAWRHRLENKLSEHRKVLGQLTAINQGVNSCRMLRIRDRLYSIYNIVSTQDLQKTIETLKQKIKAVAAHLKRYGESNARLYQNREFVTNEKAFYRKHIDSRSLPKEVPVPVQEEVENFWRGILSSTGEVNGAATWIGDIKNSMSSMTPNNFSLINGDHLKGVIKKVSNWKTPGVDNIHNFYIKHLTTIHQYLVNNFNNILNGHVEIDDWFVTGQVYLIPKNDNTKDPKNWRPIACLPTMYKLLTSVIAEELYQHCFKNNIIYPNQRGCRRYSRGCKDHLLLNKAILEDAYNRHKNLSMAWIDYQKAYDSVPHAWLLMVLELYGFSPVVINFIKEAMSKWQVVMTARATTGLIKTDPIKINCGIFQGDSLSPILFCLAMNPLSSILLSCSKAGYKLNGHSQVINHLIYMDDLKLYAKTPEELDMLLDSVEIFTHDIGMRFGLDKCRVLHLKRGTQPSAPMGGHILLDGQEVEELRPHQTYKYLGIKENGKINHSQLRNDIKQEYLRRIRKLLLSQLNSRNLFKSINTYAIPVLTYSFAIVNWKLTDIKSLDIKTRKLLTVNHTHQAKAEVERLYLPVEKGGRGLIKIESLFKRAIIKHALYFKRCDDEIVNAIKMHDLRKLKYSIQKDGQVITSQFNLDIDQMSEATCSMQVKNLQLHIDDSNWKSKSMHGQFRNYLDKAHIDNRLSLTWLKRQSIMPTLEAAIFAIQDQVVKTKYYSRNILKDQSENGICRLCGKNDETIHHIVSSCERLAATSYIWRHDNLVKYIHWVLAGDSKFDVPKQWWTWSLKEHQVLENVNSKILWEMPIQTDITVNANRPDIVYVNKAINKTYLIDVSVPSDYNVGPKEIQKIEHYHQLRSEIKRLWGTEVEVVPIIIGATGVITKSLVRYIEKLSLNVNISILQKQAAICTASIVSRAMGMPVA